MERHAAITGLGIVSGIGDDIGAFWESLLTGRSAPKPDRRELSVAAHLDRYPEALARSARRLLRGAPRPTAMTTIAALQAWCDAGPDAAPERAAHVSAAQDTLTAYAEENHRLYQQAARFVEPLYAVLGEETDIVAVSCELLGLGGPSFTIGTACASGGSAIVAGLDLLRASRADAVLVTGAACVMGATSRQGYANLDLLASSSTSRPFDARRDGFVPSEAAGAVVLERPESARRRGATVHAKLLGGAMTSDSTRQPRPGQAGEERVMREALRDAGVAADRVGYVNAHAAGTRIGDAVEMAAIRAVLGEGVPVNSTKSMTGHPMAAAGVIELIATVLQIERGVLHPTMHLECPDPELGLDIVTGQPRPHHIDVALSNSFGFGGMNACVVVGRASCNDVAATRPHLP